MPPPPSLYRALNIVGYAGWAAIVIGLGVFLFRDPASGRDTMIGGAGAIALKYLGTLALVLVSRRRSPARDRNRA